MEEVKNLASKLFDLLGVEIKIASEESIQDKQKVVTLKLDAGENTGLLIGRRGETLSAIQTFLGTSVNEVGADEWTRVVVDVGGWREKEEDRLKTLADQTAQRAIETGKAQELYNLTPAQRRVIHVALSSRKDVETVSEGEDEERHLVISPK